MVMDKNLKVLDIAHEQLNYPVNSNPNKQQGMEISLKLNT